MSRRKKNLRAFLHQHPAKDMTIEETWNAAWEGGQKHYHTKRMQELDQQLVDLLSEYRKDCIAYAHWFRSGVNRNGRTEGECFDIWLALKEQDND